MIDRPRSHNGDESWPAESIKENIEYQKKNQRNFLNQWNLKSCLTDYWKEFSVHH